MSAVSVACAVSVRRCQRGLCVRGVCGWLRGLAPIKGFSVSVSFGNFDRRSDSNRHLVSPVSATSRMRAVSEFFGESEVSAASAASAASVVSAVCRDGGSPSQCPTGHTRAHEEVSKSGCLMSFDEPRSLLMMSDQVRGAPAFFHPCGIRVLFDCGAGIEG